MQQRDIKQFSGFLNSDDSQEVIGLNQHAMAINGRFRGTGNNMRFENVPGTAEIPYNKPAGNNECIGTFYDELRQRIFWFNYNSNGNHGIYQYTIATGIIVPVVLVGLNTDGDILAFTLNGSIYAVKMLYGDSLQGDTLYFNNSQKEPCQVNIQRALTGGYGTIKRSFINVIKAPSIRPPAVVYEDDNTVTVNNLRKKLFKVKLRYVYSNNNKSVTSSQSEIALPINYMDTAVDKDPTKNCRLAIVIATGENDVSKIEVLIAISEGKVFGDYFLAKVLDKSASSIASNDLFTYRFYNNEAYIPIDIVESVQLQDLVPLQANCVELLNGNVPIYGGILESFNPTLVTGTTTSTSIPQQTTQLPFIYVGSQSGNSGFGTGNIHIVLIGKVVVGDGFNIYTTNQTITFTATVATTANVITGLAAAAVVAGFTVVSSDTENLVIVKTGESLLRILQVAVVRAVTDSPVYDWNSRGGFAIAYFDAAGRTIGAETNATMSFQTVNYTETMGVPNIPKIGLSITNRPPLHANYYHILRPKDLAKSKLLQWVSDRTYKDADFAYIGIENLNTYILNNPSSSFLQYDFATGDRIRFMKVLSGAVNTIYTNQDFEIQSQVLSPSINGIVQIGQFLKIALPATSGTFDFGTSDFYNYFIELYTPAQSASEGLETYYEFGERYAIGNAGTNLAFHQGMLQNQTPNLVTPATFEFTKGDYYYRQRTINTGAEYSYHITAGEKGDGRFTVGMTFDSTTYTDPNIMTGNSPLQSLAGFNIATNNDRWILKIGTGTFRFRIKGSITATFYDVDEIFGFSFYLQTNDSIVTVLVPSQVITVGTHTYTFDVPFQLTTGQRIFIFGYSNGDLRNSKVFQQSDIKITRDLSYTVGIVDPNFSDFFVSAVNANGRSMIVDSNAAQIFYPTLLRWGLSFDPDTNLNRTNTFREVNFDEIDRSKGQIWRMKVRDRIIRYFQERGCGQAGVYGKFVQSNNGNFLTTTDEIITKNNVQYYAGIFGLGNQPTSLVSGKNQDYFVDPVRGYHLRLSGDGFTPISEIYKGQFYIQPLFVPYNNDYLRLNGSRAKILGYYDYFEEQYVTILQGGVLNGQTIQDYAFSFNEKRNSYCSFYDFNPEMIISANDITYSWKNGALYIHNDQGKNRNFYGIPFYPSITFIFNDKIAIKKTYQSLSYQANNVWTAPIEGDIISSQPNPQTGLVQTSVLRDFDFDVQEGLYYAALNFDMNSLPNKIQAIYEGDFLKGVWLQVKLTCFSSEYSWLYLPTLNWLPSPRN